MLIHEILDAATQAMLVLDNNSKELNVRIYEATFRGNELFPVTTWIDKKAYNVKDFKKLAWEED